MGLKRSKTFRILKDRGLYSSLLYLFGSKFRKLGEKMEFMSAGDRSVNSLRYEKLWNKGVELPKNYKGILIHGGVSGGVALCSFLSRMGGCVFGFDPWNPKHYRNMAGLYDSMYEASLRAKNKNQLLAYCNPGGDYDLEETARFFSLCSNEVPVLFLVRDPISRLKSYANHGILCPAWEDRSNMATLMHDPSRILDRLQYNFNEEEFSRYPTTKSVKIFCHEAIFWCFSLVKILPGNSEILYIDMKDIVGDRVFGTLTYLSEVFDLPKPKEEDLPFFKTTRWNSLFKLLYPSFTIFIHPKHLGKSYSPESSIVYYQNSYKECIINEAGSGGVNLLVSLDSGLSSQGFYKNVTEEFFDINIYLFKITRFYKEILSFTMLLRSM